MTDFAFKPEDKWITLLNGAHWFPYEPDPNKIDIKTIAVVLARKCRFADHLKKFYSIAQHSIFVSELCPPHLKLAGLLHDAHEVYTGFGDVAKPMKTYDIKCVEAGINCAIAKKFGFDHEQFASDEIHYADRVALFVEAENFLEGSYDDWVLPKPDDFDNKWKGKRLTPWSTKSAERWFLETFNELTYERVSQS